MSKYSPYLNPCEDCGAEFSYEDGICELPSGTYYIMCPKCETMTEDFPSAALAVSAWNSGDVVLDEILLGE